MGPRGTRLDIEWKIGVPGRGVRGEYDDDVSYEVPGTCTRECTDTETCTVRERTVKGGGNQV